MALNGLYMGLSQSLAGESQHQINGMGTTYWKATGREKRTVTGYWYKNA